MGLLDFVMEIGHHLFSRGDEKAAEKIRTHLLADNPGIVGLTVSYENGFVTLGGSAQTWESVEKAILLAGNIQGVGRVISNIGVAEIASHAPQELGGSATIRYYEIRPGDTLSHIARQFYGDGAQYPKIFEANREVIKDPNTIFVGQKIRIPA